MPIKPFTELGTSGLKRSGGVIDDEFVTMLRGDVGRRFLREMADNSPIAGAILFAFEKVILGLGWRVDPAETDDEALAETAQASADFVKECLDDMSMSWDATLSEVCTMFTYGWSLMELVYKRRVGRSSDATKTSQHDDGRIGWRKWGPRAQDTLLEWLFDDNNEVIGMRQLDPYMGGGPVDIPLEKCLLFRTTSTRTNPEGKSLLRSGAPSWYMQKRMQEIEAVGVERDLAGLPVAWVPQEWLMEDATASEVAALAAVKDIVTNVKRNEQEGIILPAMVDDETKQMVPTVDFKLMSSGGSRAFDTDKIITRYEQRIAMSVLMDFLLLGHEAVGSKALSVSKIDLWTMAVDAIARSVCETVNSHAIPQLLALNGMNVDLCPKLAYGEVGKVDVEGLSVALQRLLTSGAIAPDATLEAQVRETFGLPPREDDEQDLDLPDTPPATGGVDGPDLPTVPSAPAQEESGPEAGV